MTINFPWQSRRCITGAAMLLFAGCGGVSSHEIGGSTASKLPHPAVEVFDSRASRILDTAARLRVLADGHAWTEGPLWIDDGGYLLYSDIPNNVIMKYVPGQ